MRKIRGVCSVWKLKYSKSIGEYGVEVDEKPQNRLVN